jgi:hypothetical protein
MVAYDRTVGRLRVVVNENGAFDQQYGHGAIISCPTGWNDCCPIQTHTVSVEELRDLRYLLDRAIDAAEEHKRRRS